MLDYFNNSQAIRANVDDPGALMIFYMRALYDKFNEFEKKGCYIDKNDPIDDLRLISAAEKWALMYIHQAVKKKDYNATNMGIKNL